MNAASDIRLFDDLDRPWITSLLELVTNHLGKPWRVLLDRIEHSDLEVHPARVSTVVRAIRRLTGGKAERGKVARAVRALVLGHPALDVDERDARLAAAAARLGLEPADIEPLLWADLALERPVAFASGPPRIDSLLAFANLDRVQRYVRRARSLKLRVRGPANELVRTVARYGLIAQIRRGSVSGSALSDHAARETILDVTGPLALFHSTTVYGKALAQLVPLLAEQPDFTLEIECEFDGAPRTLGVAPPIRLPSVPASKRAPSAGERLARDLERLGYAVDREPDPIAAGADLLFSELAVEVHGRRWLIEIVGFSTAEHLAYKLERYAAAGIANVIVLADLERSAELLDDSRIVPFKRRIDATALVEQLGNRAVPS